MEPEEVPISKIVDDCIKNHVAILCAEDLSCMGCGFNHPLICARTFPTIPVTEREVLYHGGVLVFLCGNCVILKGRPALEKVIIEKIQTAKAYIVHEQPPSDDTCSHV